MMAEEAANSDLHNKVVNIKFHGIPNAYTGATLAQRLMWSLISVAALGASVFGIVTSVRSYSQYPVKVDLTYKDESLTSFPAVTICNLNARRTFDHEASQNELTDNATAPISPGSVAETEADRISRGHQLSDMLLSCAYKSMACRSSHFILVNGSIGSSGGGDAGNCYTFNSGMGKKMYVLNPLMTGRSSALRLVLNTEPELYARETTAAGFSLTIQDSGHFPTPESKVISVAPGFATFIELSQGRLIRAEKPYGDCEQISSERNKRLNMWAHYGYNYSANACKYTYIQQQVMDRCGCPYDKLPVPPNLASPIEECGADQVDCSITEYKHLMSRFSFTDVCPLPCEESSYETVVSSHVWPSDAKLQTWKNPYGLGSNLTSDEVRARLVWVSVYYASLKVRSIVESPLYGIFNLLAEIGGHLGLWVGVSLLAICELVEIMAGLVSMMFSSPRKSIN